MIWLSSRELEYALAEGKLDSWEKVKYLILPAVLGALFSRSFFLIQPHYGKHMPIIDSSVFIICGIISAFLIYSGIKQCFYTNKITDDKAFFERFVILSVPPLFKIAAIAIVLSLSILITVIKLREEIPFLFKHVSIFIAVLSPITTYIYYILIDNSFFRLRELLQEKESTII